MGKFIYLAEPRGFCAGVRRALAAVDDALNRFDPPIFVFNSIVHNNFIVESLRQRGITFVNSLNDVPPGAPLIFSAHGVSRQIEEQAGAMNLQIIDATCPLVKKIHHRARELAEAGDRVILIGHRSHPEIIGTLGQIEGEAEVIETVADVAHLKVDERQVSCLTQTTLSIYDTEAVMAALRNKFPGLDNSATDICYATRRRQEAVMAMTDMCDVIFIIGSEASSNSNRMRETAERAGTRAFMLDSADELEDVMLIDVESIGVSAGASAPENLVIELIEQLKLRGWHDIRKFDISEINKRKI
jgi:4-hydroxy-3-methylbut-2-en-1-yl diphosphate reductase